MKLLAAVIVLLTCSPALSQDKNFHYLISGDLSGRQFGNENAKVETAVGEYIFEQIRFLKLNSVYKWRKQ